MIEVATELFAAEGFDAVSIESVLAACGISRGALYHHFPGKEALFAAVVDVVEARIAATVAATAGSVADPLASLFAAATAWLELAARDPAVRRIVLTDGPAVLSPQLWQEIEERYALGLVQAALARLAEAGHLPAERVGLYANLLLAMLTRAAFLIARAPDPEAEIATCRETLAAVVGGLLRE
ncbi:MAG: TetR/AcrR family transcriptional regulator [Methylobacteriaceae bacterium]|nr:TetR/AcrR family transcriptional regulator [Methylobacteriaceae bacterium]